MVRKKIWKSNLEVGREGAYETDTGRWGGQRVEEAKKVPGRCFSHSKEIQSEVTLYLKICCK